ncbi:MAG: 3,2-trans-enoyl-CoA isomerase [Flavobacteriales bacterium]|jgi:3,2-trans-enoyl-CoA isomerase
MSTLIINSEKGYSIIQLNRGNSNPINQEMVDELKLRIEEFEEDENCKGIILTGKERFFSAGLDVIEMYDYDQFQMETFWRSFHELLKTMVSFSKPMIAAITGHSPAGGCILALCCDYRVMASGKFKIGLNEISVGVLAPPAITTLYSFAIGRSLAYQYLMEAKLMNADEALSCHLIHEVVEESEVFNAAQKKMQQYLSFNQEAWRGTKKQIRATLFRKLDLDFSKAFKPTMQAWWSDEGRSHLGVLVNSLTK